MKKLQPRRYVYIVLFAMILVGYAGIIVLWQQQRHQTRDLQAQIDTGFDNALMDQTSSYNAVTIVPSEGAVYLPLADLKLPATTLSEGLMYSYTSAHKLPGSESDPKAKTYPAQLSITTHDLAANNSSSTKQFDCTQVVYADFVTPSYPVNPSYKTDGSVKLTDGRMMNVYYAPSIPGCAATWKLQQIDAKAVADALKQAVSY